jgi:hypothetical protein
LGKRLDASFFGAFADEKEKYIGLCMLQRGRRVEQGVEPVGVADGPDIAGYKFSFGVELAAYV